MYALHADKHLPVNLFWKKNAFLQGLTWLFLLGIDVRITKASQVSLQPFEAEAVERMFDKSKMDGICLCLYHDVLTLNVNLIALRVIKLHKIIGSLNEKPMNCMIMCALTH